METISTTSPAPSRFKEALESIRQAELPQQVILEEIPAPARVASYGLALEASLPGDQDDSDAAAGSFVLLHEPGGHAVWNGDFRIVTVARADLEPELATDELTGQVTWTWLVEALNLESLATGELAGTVTRTISEPFGSLKRRGWQAGIELRASWTPTGPDVGQQLTAWLSLLAKLGGVELLPRDVAVLRHRA
ncbi:MAG: DUF3000 domain-containing protein [Bifidobacteriaceae bacterium]|jgi:hypothetical protein|nr:DUF3000 domain-containing protein [Bifidobacteriaceae bacterium]